MKKTIFFFLSGIVCLYTNSQTITSQRNRLRSGDFIIKQQVGFKDPGASGKDIQWDFSNLDVKNDKYQLVYFFPVKGDSSHIMGVEHDTRYHYKFKADTLWLTGYENRTTQMTYQQPEAILRFPFRYGDTLTSVFSGTGLYGQRIELIAKGKTTACVDAVGKLITPENDTLKNVIRIKRTKEFADIGADSVNIRLENYQWFAPGSRYPVFETIRSYEILLDTITDSFSTSFYFSTISREQLPEDLANADIKLDGANADNILINCNTYPNPVASDLTVNYELSVNASISFLLCDISGRPWANIPKRTLNAGIQYQKIPMDGLKPGDYGLYITVNDKVYKRIIIKK